MAGKRGVPNRYPDYPNHYPNKPAIAHQQGSQSGQHCDGARQVYPHAGHGSSHTDTSITDTSIIYPYSHDPHVNNSPMPPDDEPPRRTGGWFARWAFWMTFAIALLGGMTGFSMALLYKLPNLPNCPSIFWPTASASLRLYCAELAAKKNTTDDLLQAIRLMDGLPDDHPLRDEANQMIDGWSLDILALADQEFQQGNLEKAIEIAEQIPVKGTAYSKVDERIENWQETWAQAERIYQEAVSALQSDDLRKAFSSAVKLLDVGNDYWATAKYDELNQLIETSRTDSNLLAEARSLAQQRSLGKLLDAIALVEDIDEDSFLYPVARRLIVELWDDMLDLGKAALDSGNVDDVLRIADRLPPGAEYQAQADDLRTLALAVTQAQRGTVADLESAMVQANDMPPSRPLYSQAQQLARRWRIEIQDVQRLALALQLAAPGTVDAYREAIAEAEMIPASNPRGTEAKSLISGWYDDIYTIEDRPYLERAEEIARRGDIFSLQAAILEAQRVGEGRPLSGEASRLVQTWTRRVERIQDQPILAEANQFARSGNLQQAIATAQQIESGRALYEEAQTSIQEWQSQIIQTAQRQQGANQIRLAVDRATVGTPSALASAIQVANQVDAGNPSRAEADRMINQWSEMLLQIAQQEAARDLERAIAVAELIPPQTTAFAPAQLQLREWRSRLGGQPIQ